MKSMRVQEHPILGNSEKKEAVTIYFDGKPYTAYTGDTVASALLASGVRTLRKHEETASPRGIYCNIGHCFECRVQLNGSETVRACLTTVADGMYVTSLTLPKGASI
ncbi:sarcosine oxidase subunit alpha [Terribacillus aidingensis]|uniref:Sarcosine oxidase subunit alpha n=2 Tax=Terribacillus aidingensis TaxID=586416 RepID=A0A285P726_9BACI|nr:sarcosine oxidase subunit alpha [Terribacillus aidingensis]